jgi:hypothetical protein
VDEHLLVGGVVRVRTDAVPVQRLNNASADCFALLWVLTTGA